MARLTRRLNETWEADFETVATTDRCEALPDADIVVGVDCYVETVHRLGQHGARE